MMIAIPPSSSIAKPFAVDWLINDPAPVSDMIPMRIKKIPKDISNVFLFIAISFGVYCNANQEKFDFLTKNLSHEMFLRLK